ncbi:MAG: Rv1733c family protein [Pseudonocardia sp.]
MDVEQPDGRPRPQHPPRPRIGDRIPRRPTDRVEDAAAWLLTSLALLAGLIATVSGWAGAAGGIARAETEQRERVPVRVVLLQAADVSPSLDGLPVRVDVPGRWLLPDGTERVGPVGVGVRTPAGAEVTAWVDRAGRPAAAPGTTGVAGIVGALPAVLLVLATWPALVVAWWAVRRWTAARNSARWAREWARVEPRWSGRLPWQ